MPPAPVVAKRLCDLLLSFPSAAISGVQWSVLVSRYEERYAARLDLVALGHSSALGAATTLLWDVLRIVDKDDTDNPVVGIDDGVAIAAQPDCMSSWPSLYGALCSIVQEHGTLDAGADARSLLLSQLRPLLERHWHASFDESALGFRGEDGAFVRFKKMKHLLHAVLRWREQRQAWQQSRCLNPTEVDEVLKPTLELIPARGHNDLVLRCASTITIAALASRGVRSKAEDAIDFPPAAGMVGLSDLRSEVERLRAENDQLRATNLQLQVGAPQLLHSEPLTCSTPELPADVFDDPFEPPPELASWMSWRSSSADTDSESHSVLQGCGSSAGWQSGHASTCASGDSTPVHHKGVPQASCAMMPAWFPFVQTASLGVIDISVIPGGIVQSARKQFERIVGQ